MWKRMFSSGGKVLIIGGGSSFIGTRGFLHHYDYQFERNQNFINGFRGLLLDLGFGKDESSWFGRPVTESREPILTKEMNINDLNGVHERFENKKYCIDIIFGNETLVFISSLKDSEKEIKSALAKFAEWKYTYNIDKDSVAKLKK